MFQCNQSLLFSMEQYRYQERPVQCHKWLLINYSKYIEDSFKGNVPLKYTEAIQRKTHPFHNIV